jgi:spore maturation protein CgeB
VRIAMFYHSLVSDWNHGNAHFLRGIVSELRFRGHEVRVYEPADGWSLKNLRDEHGEKPIEQFRAIYPGLESIPYDLERFDADKELDDADLVIVHEWNPPELIHLIGKHRARGGKYRLLFHDTHHRAVTEPQAMSR